MDARRAVNGALAGSAAAGLWALQQPLDKLAFRCGYDDIEILGKLVTRGPAWPAVGSALHVGNGALFGAVYALARARVSGPAGAHGVAAGVAEHLSLWPLTRSVDRYHPARREMITLAGNTRAFLQALWRHLLFGVVLGVLEGRLNRPPRGLPASLDSVPGPE